MTDVGYSGTPLVRKLGIKAGQRVLYVAAPESFDPQPLPDGVKPHSRAGAGSYDMIVAFCTDLADLGRRFAPLRDKLPPTGTLWIAWPKKASGVQTDLTDNTVREHGLAQGMVDVKVCAIDAIWSGEKFVFRLADR